jgi:hypothetical protein
MKTFLGISIVSVLVLFGAFALSADQGNPDTAASTNNRVVIVEGDAPAKVEVGEVVRVTGSGPSGMVEINAKTEGPVKLATTNSIRRVVNGGNMIGEMTKEFEVKARSRGAAKIIVTIVNKIAKTTDTNVFNLEIR